VALATLALGIGANTAVFSTVNGVVLKQLSYPDADRLVFLQQNNLSRGWTTFTITPDDFRDWREQNGSMELSAAFSGARLTYTGGDRPQSLVAYQVSDGFLEIMGGQPTLGRGIVRDDLSPGASPVVLLSHGFWMQTFGGDPDVIGRTMALNGVPRTVVGILPAGWRSPFTQPDLIVPLGAEQWGTTARREVGHFLYGLGRLKPGVTVAQARADLSSIALGLAEQYPETNAGWGVVVTPLREVILGSTGQQLTIFMAAVVLILLIVCANLGNMTLARVATRTRELAIRSALGAGRGRVVRQLLAESLLLSAVGGALGVILAYAALQAFVREWPTMLPRMDEVGIDTTVLLFSLGLSLVCGIIFGIVPALSVAGSRIRETLHQGGRTRRWMRAALVTGEVGLTVMLLVGCGLLLRSFSALRSEDPGFRTDNRLVLSTALPEAKYSSRDALRRYGEAALERLQALPGVQSVGLTSLVPLTGADNIGGFWLRGRTAKDGQEDGSALLYRVSAGYAAAMGIHLVAGRWISADDRATSAQVVVISQSLASQHFAGEDPVGQHLGWGAQQSVEIVGVVGDVQHYALGQDLETPQVYVPFRQSPSTAVNFVLDASVPPASLVNAARGVIHDIDPDLVVGPRLADALISNQISLPRFRMLVMTGFGLTALLLAVVGLYGVLAYSVSQRTREIGVRMALGATRGSVLGLVLREGAPLVVLGLGVGLAGALAVSRILQSMLFGVGARDVLVFSVVPVVLAVVAAVAMLGPARRAARVDPIRTLGDV
jgi:putative ABC transport system permease protein